MFKLINRFFFGGTYKVVHICNTTGKRKIFWCDTWMDALEWAACALNCDKVTVTDTMGFVVATRG